jgi:DNA-binding transcriptional LysR family regulator
MDFNLDRLRTFIVVARMKNLSAAAKELGATQPNVGRQMAALEKEVNLVLFSRHSRGLDLTKQGQEFLDLCHDIVGRLAQGTDVIRERDSEPEGRFNFVCGIGLLETILENIVSFSEKFPKISFGFSSTTNVYQLQIGGADAAVMLVPQNASEPDFIQRPLYNNPMRIYASPHYFQSHPMPQTLKDLNFHKVILFAGEDQESLNQQIMGSNLEGFSHPFIKVATTPAMRTALINGAGIGCYGYHQEIIDKGLLVDVFPDMPDQVVPYYYTYHKRLEGSPKIEAFYEFLKDITKIWERP